MASHFSLLNRPENKDNKVPGPGNYDTKREDLSPDGKYLLSKMRNSLVRSFASSERERGVPKSMIPGPGAYRMPSEFGYYTAKNSAQSSSITKSSEL